MNESVDVCSVVGLCGLYDDDSSNDLSKRAGGVSGESGRFPNDFSKSWRYTLNCKGSRKLFKHSDDNFFMSICLISC